MPPPLSQRDPMSQFRPADTGGGAGNLNLGMGKAMTDRTGEATDTKRMPPENPGGVVMGEMSPLPAAAAPACSAAPPPHNRYGSAAGARNDDAAAERYFSLSPSTSATPVTARSKLPTQPNTGQFTAGGFRSQQQQDHPLEATNWWSMVPHDPPLEATNWSSIVPRDPPDLMNGAAEPPFYGQDAQIPTTPPMAHLDVKRLSKQDSEFSNVPFSNNGGNTSENSSSNEKLQGDAEKQAAAMRTEEGAAEDWATYIHRKRKELAIGMTALILIALAFSLTVRFTVMNH